MSKKTIENYLQKKGIKYVKDFVIPESEEKKHNHKYGQYLDATADEIQNRPSDDSIIFYFLKDYSLHELEFESIVNDHGVLTEITLKEVTSDEGGNVEKPDE